ncbi:MAG: response regulator [Terriglobia bacterium]
MSRKILIIDDEQAIREVTQLTLETINGWAVLTADSGQQGLTVASVTLPDAILLDVMMADMDGPHTLRELQSNPATRNIPVIFLTAKVQREDVRRFGALGVKAVLAKPFDPLHLGEDIARVLGWERTGDGG